MSKAGNSRGPNTPEERQAAATLASAQSVLREIERLSQRLGDTAQERDKRQRAKHDLAEASDRLCNLMALAVYQIANGGHGEYQQRLKGAVDALRGRLLDMGTSLMVEKLRLVHSRAAEVLKGGGYPLGLASKLEQTYAAIRSNLETLGALERLGETDVGMMNQTAVDIRSLAAMEEKLGVLREMGARKG